MRPFKNCWRVWGFPAQLYNAGLIPDPYLIAFWPIGVKQLEQTLYQSFTAIWIVPVQKKAAQADMDQLANQLVQNGLDVIRDTRLAHADWMMAQQQLKVAEQMRDLRQQLRRLALRQNEAGAISELEAVAPLLEQLNAESEIARLRGSVQAARARLLFLMGLPEDGRPLVAVADEYHPIEVPPAQDVLAEAFEVRPDLLAARYAMEAARKRVKLQKLQKVDIRGIADSNSRGIKGFEIGPGTWFSIPIFNANHGNIAIAEAQYEIAKRRYFTVRNQVQQDVLVAHAQLAQASNNLSIVENKILPATRNASELAKKNFEGGGASYVLTLQTVGQNLTAQTTKATLMADLARALAEMERSIGHQLDLPPAPAPPPSELPPVPAPASCPNRKTTIRRAKRNPHCPSCRPAAPCRIPKVCDTRRGNTNSAGPFPIGKIMMNKAQMLGGLMLAVCFTGCGAKGTGSPSGSKAKPQKSAPAKVEAHPNERDIYRITLTPKAESRLGIQTVPLAVKPLPRHRTVGGELMLPDGALLLVTAPVSGTVRIPHSSETPLPGSKLALGEKVLTINPLLSPERYVPSPAERVQMANAQVSLVTAQVQASGDVKRSEEETKAAQIALARAERLLKDRAGPAQDVDTAKAQLAIAQEALKAANQRLKALENISLDVDPSPMTGATKNAKPLPIASPQSGVLQKVSVADGQYVTAGANLFQVVKLDTLWVRVPVYVGLLDQIESSSMVQVRMLDQPQTKSVSAQQITAPPTADPLAATADLYFAIANPHAEFRPGERVDVTLPLNTDRAAESHSPRCGAVGHPGHELGVCAFGAERIPAGTDLD